MDNPKQLEQDVKTLFDRIETEFPGVSQAMEVLNMSYADYLSILQNSQPPSCFTGNNTIIG